MSYRFVGADQLFDGLGTQELATVLRATVAALSTGAKAFELIVEGELVVLGDVSDREDTDTCLTVHEPVSCVSHVVSVPFTYHFWVMQLGSQE